MAKLIFHPVVFQLCQIAPAHGGRSWLILVCKNNEKPCKTIGCSGENARKHDVFVDCAAVFAQNYEKTCVERMVTSDRAVRELRNWMTLGIKSWQAMGEVSCQVAHPFCVSAGRGCVFDACFCAVLRGSDGAVDENVVFFRVFVRAPYGFIRFFVVFAYQNQPRPSPMCWRDLVPRQRCKSRQYMRKDCVAFDRQKLRENMQKRREPWRKREKTRRF